MKRREFFIAVSTFAASNMIGAPLLAKGGKWRKILGADLTGGLGGAGAGSAIPGLGTLLGGLIGAAGASLSASIAAGEDAKGGVSSNPANKYDEIGQLHNQICSAYRQRHDSFDVKSLSSLILDQFEFAQGLDQETIIEIAHVGVDSGMKSLGMDPRELGEYTQSLLPKSEVPTAFGGQIAKLVTLEVDELLEGSRVLEDDLLQQKLDEGVITQAMGLSILRNSAVLWS